MSQTIDPASFRPSGSQIPTYVQQNPFNPSLQNTPSSIDSPASSNGYYEQPQLHMASAMGGAASQPYTVNNGYPAGGAYYPSQAQMDQQPMPSSGKAKSGKDKLPVDTVRATSGNGHVVPFKEGPVKAACLNCRSKKAKCDGVQPVCGACQKKNLECQFVKSRRGGARKKREVVPPSALQEFLKKLDGLLGIPDFKVTPGHRNPTDDITNIVRQFTSREEIFRCYYNEVHPFMAVMPPRHLLDTILPTLLPQSPFLLAAQVIMVLVPHPLDPEPSSADSKRLRSAASHELAKQTTDAINRLVELGQTNLECVQALTMLSLWEWGANGSVHRNRARTGQATQLAMELNLHDMDKYSHAPGNKAVEGQDWKLDMARRTWWMTYVNQLISSIITGTSPVMSAEDPRIHVDYPVCSLDDQSWARWISANRKCAIVFDTVNTVYSNLAKSGGGGNTWGTQQEVSDETKEQMKKEIYEVDAQMNRMMKEAEEEAIIELVPGGEEEVVRNQQLSARLGISVVHIHIHRHQAFPEVSLFSKMICGIPKMGGDMSEEDIDLPALAQLQQQQQVTNGDESNTPNSGVSIEERDPSYEFIEDMWQPETYPENLPEPWFAHADKARSLYAPIEQAPSFHPDFQYAPSNASSTVSPPASASIQPIQMSSPEGIPSNVRTARRPSTMSTASNKPHKAWGVDANDKPQAELPIPVVTQQGSRQAPNVSDLNVFPPGVSLARCATAAHTVVRLEVLHRSAIIALWDGPPKWMPFCACGLVTGAYAFLLLALAVQAESAYNIPTDRALEQIDGLLTNVKVIVAGLEAYGTMWDGIEVMAGEVRAALEAVTQLPNEMRRQLAAAEAAQYAQFVPAAYLEPVPSSMTDNSFDSGYYNGQQQHQQSAQAQTSSQIQYPMADPDYTMVSNQIPQYNGQISVAGQMMGEGFDGNRLSNLNLNANGFGGLVPGAGHYGYTNGAGVPIGSPDHGGMR